jgi:two-component system response regulator YesN
MTSGLAATAAPGSRIGLSRKTSSRLSTRKAIFSSGDLCFLLWISAISLLNWESLGYTVIGEAYSGTAALEMIMEEKPDVVLSDIRMPGLDGIELLERINREKLKTAVILISGYSEFEYAQKALRLGVFEYLLKPVDKNKLNESLSRLKIIMGEKKKAHKGLSLRRW